MTTPLLFNVIFLPQADLQIDTTGGKDLLIGFPQNGAEGDALEEMKRGMYRTHFLK